MKRDKLSEFFAVNNKKAADITEQNNRWDVFNNENTSGQYDSLPGLAEAINNGLHTEQNETIQELSGIDEQPYREMYPLIEQCQQELAMLRELLGKSHEEIQSLQDAALNAAARGLELAPRSKEEIEDLLIKYEAEIEGQYSDIPKQVEQKEKDLEELESIAEVAGQAWPVPAVGREAINTEIPEYVDRYDIEDTPGDYTCGQRKTPEQLYSKEMSASEKCAKFMLVHQGQSQTLKDIALSVYDDIRGEFTSEDEMLAICTNRVASLFNTNQKSAQILGEQGYVIQRGYRFMLDKDGNQVGARIRIQRALKDNDPRLKIPYEEHFSISSEDGETSLDAAASPVDESVLKDYEDASTAEGLMATLVDFYEDAYDAAKRLDSMNVLPANLTGTLTAQTLKTRLTRAAKNLKKCNLYSSLQFFIDEAGRGPQRKFSTANIVSLTLEKRYKELARARRVKDQDMINDLLNQAINEHYFEKRAYKE